MRDVTEEAPKKTRASGILGATALGLITTGSTALAALVRSKASALALGTEGVGLVAEIQQLLTLLSVPAAALTGAALTKALVDARATGGLEGLRNQVRRSASTALLLTAVAALIGAGAAPRLFGSEAGEIWLTAALAGSGVVSFTLLGTYGQLLLVEGHVRDASTVMSTSILAGAVISALGVTLLGVNGLFFGLLTGPLIALPLALRRVTAKLGVGPWLPVLYWDSKFIRLAARLGGAALVGTLATQFALASIRIALQQSGGLALNGLFQAAWALDSLFLGAVTSGMASYYFPRFAAAAGKEALQAEADEAVAFVAKMGPPAVLAFIGVRDVALYLAYSSQFADAAFTLGLLSVGDAFKLMAWVLAAPLLYRGQIRPYIIGEVVAACLLGGVAFLGVPRFGLAAVGVAQITTYIVYLPLTRYLLSSTLGVRVRLGALVSAPVAAACGLAVVLTSSVWPIANLAGLAASAIFMVVLGWHREVLRRLTAMRRLGLGKKADFRGD